MDSYKLLQLPKRLGYFFANPVSFGIYSTRQSVTKQFQFVFEARTAAQENKAIQEQLGKVLSENANLRRELAETEAILKQEKSISPQTYKTITARPIGKDRYLRIDRGFVDGVKEGQAVIFQDNYIGQIIRVSEKSAHVELATDPDSKISAFSFGKDGKAHGLLLGQFEVDMLLDRILHEEQIAKDDLVYSEGIEGFLPRGVILGKVVEVYSRENELFKQAKVAPIFNIRDLDLVFVITE